MKINVNIVQRGVWSPGGGRFDESSAELGISPEFTQEG
jgi:hypothetical protein